MKPYFILQASGTRKLSVNLDQEALLALGDRIPFAHTMSIDAAGRTLAHRLIVKPVKNLP
jgi:hypothetical protein